VLLGREGSKDSADATAALFGTGAGKAAAGGAAAAAAARLVTCQIGVWGCGCLKGKKERR
jgi:hypothetical protein